MPPENLTVKRKPAKTKAERKGDCNSRYTAEQLRLNPMLAMEDEEEEKKGGSKPSVAKARKAASKGRSAVE